jgi:hypothetical protein
MMGFRQWITMNTIATSSKETINAWRQEPHLMLPFLANLGVRTLLLIAEYAEWSSEAGFPIHCFVARVSIAKGWQLMNPGGFREPITSKTAMEQLKDVRKISWMEIQLTGDETLKFITQSTKKSTEEEDIEIQKSHISKPDHAKRAAKAIWHCHKD